MDHSKPATSTRSWCPPLRAALFACLALAGLAAQATVEPDSQTTLLYAEGIEARWQAMPGPQAAGSARNRLSFHAFGREFDLELAPNNDLGPAPAPATLYRGRIEGLAGSWVRLAIQGGALSGLIYDGAEFFGVEPVAQLATVLGPNVAQPADGSMIYRLSDLLVEPGVLAHLDAVPMDPAADAPGTAAHAMRALAAGIGGMAPATVPTYRIHIAPLADQLFAGRFGSNAVTEMLVRLNIADGIFSSQLGVTLVADAPVVPGPAGLDAVDAGELLEQLGSYRRTSSTTAGITHLFTNRSFAGGIAGMAWNGGMCTAKFGASLSTSAGITQVLSGLVAAHEIGHNFGAPHDGEEFCAATPDGYLMAPTITSTSTSFSPCSLAVMGALIEESLSLYPAASCLSLVANFDVALVLPENTATTPGAVLVLPLRVQNQGNQPVSTLGLQIDLPAALEPMAITTLGGLGSCSPVATQISCSLPALGSGAAWDVELEVRVGGTGQHAISASLSAAADEVPQNNQGQFIVSAAGSNAGAQGGNGGDGGGGGGGGMLDLLSLLLLLAAAPVRQWHRNGSWAV
ncbi:MAG: hypothetical protein H3C57_07470 [Gammaproteobacteria bacterium]|nr:hypothetical protein [Gammaproteobacteria bacterium]